MQIISFSSNQNIQKIQIPKKPWIALGNFDGVHLGHQSILQSVKKQAQNDNTLAGVFLLDPHPQTILKPNSIPKIITSTKEKLEWFEKFDMDFCIVYPFDNNFSQKSPDEFAKEILKDLLDVKGVSLGYNYSFGKNRQGNPVVLTQLGKELDFQVIVCSQVQVNEQPVSSSIIRECIINGNVSKAAELLGRPYRMVGKVVHGEKRGRTIGFPTANLQTDFPLIPKNGIYTTMSEIDNTYYHSVTHIGPRPTFQSDNPVIETFILDQNFDIYGKIMSVHFIQWIRCLEKFDSAESLKQAIASDVEQARESFSEVKISN